MHTLAQSLFWAMWNAWGMSELELIGQDTNKQRQVLIQFEKDDIWHGSVPMLEKNSLKQVCTLSNHREHNV